MQRFVTLRGIIQLQPGNAEYRILKCAHFVDYKSIAPKMKANSKEEVNKVDFY